MPGEFITKRPHKKSRGGCKTCKTKKIKCDEALPKCGFCSKRDLTCQYVVQPTQQPTPESSKSTTPEATLPLDTVFEPPYSTVCTSIIRSPSPPTATPAGYLTPNDLRAMHFWSCFTSQSITPGDYATELFQVTIPQLAFEHSYLLDVMLGISSLHMQSLIPQPEQERRQTALYRTRAFSGFREALSNVTPANMGSWEAALVTSILLTILCSREYEVDDGDLIVLQWIQMYRGLSTVISMGKFEMVLGSRVAPLFRRSLNDLITEPLVPQNLFQMLEAIPPYDPDYEHLDVYKKSLNILGVLYASLVQDGISAATIMRVVTWPSMLGSNFAALTKEKRPRVLILLAHYLVFIKCCAKLWWMNGVAGPDITRILRMVPPRWFPLLEVPRKSLQISDQEELTQLLLSSVNTNFTSAVKMSVREYPHAIKYYAPTSPEDHDIDCD